MACDKDLLSFSLGWTISVKPKTTTLFMLFAYVVALCQMMLLVEAFSHANKMQMIEKAQKQGQLSDFGFGNGLLWLEIANSSPGVFLYYREMI